MCSIRPQPTATKPKGPWLGALSLLLVSLLIILAIGFAVPLWSGRRPTRLPDSFATADRIVVRDGGFDCCGPVDGEPALFEVTDPAEIAMVAANLEFTGTGPPCLCCGFPGIDWYQGKQRIALTAVQHGNAVRWRGDWQLTQASSKWLVQWLVDHGVNEKEIERGCGGPRSGARRKAAAKTSAQDAPSRGESP